MSGFKEFDIVSFHSPSDKDQASEVFIVVDKTAENESIERMKVMEVYRALTYQMIQTFNKSDFKLLYRPDENEIELIKKGKTLYPQGNLSSKKKSFYK